MSKPEFTQLDYVERLRTYLFPDMVVQFANVTAVAVSASGTHRLEFDGGGRAIVPTGWRSILIDTDDWTM